MGQVDTRWQGWIDDSCSELLSSGNGFVRLNAEDTWEAGKSHGRDSLYIYIYRVLFEKKDVDST